MLSICGVVLAGPLLLAGCSGHDSSTPAPTPTAGATQTVVDSLISTGLGQLSKNDTTGARKSFEAVIAIDADNVYANYDLGYIAQGAGQDAAAIDYYTTAIDADTTFAPALYNLAILTEPSDLSAAVDLYRRVIAVKPDDAATYARLGAALTKLGKTAEGEQMLAKAAELQASPSSSPS
jgi:Tfp pilus assembly protein PilF